MGRITTWLGIGARWLVDAEAWDKVSAILRRAAIIGALVVVGAALGHQTAFATGTFGRFAAALLLVTALPFASYSVIKRLGDGDFFDGLRESAIAFGIVAALLILTIEISIPMEAERWVSSLVGVRLNLRNPTIHLW